MEVTGLLAPQKTLVKNQTRLNLIFPVPKGGWGQLVSGFWLETRQTMTSGWRRQNSRFYLFPLILRRSKI